MVRQFVARFVGFRHDKLGWIWPEILCASFGVALALRFLTSEFKTLAVTVRFEARARNMYMFKGKHLFLTG